MAAKRAGGDKPAKKAGGDKLLPCLACFVLSMIFLSTVQMMVYLRVDTTNALHFVTGEHGVPGLVWNGSHHVQTKAHSLEHGAAPALRGRSHAAAHGVAHRPGSNQCHLGGPFGGYLSGCSQGCAAFETFAAAQSACLAEPTCGGVTSPSENSFELRAFGETAPSPSGNEMSYRKFCADISDPPEVQRSPPPAEWEPPPDYSRNYEAPGRYVDGQPTIFMNIASYRDDLCHNTIKEALRMAQHPNRLIFGVVEQSIPSQGDLPCNFTMVPCDVDPDQLLCRHASQIVVDQVDARGAQGPTYGRYRADRLYRGEHFALQLDAHMYFVHHWDVKMIAQWQATGNDYAVLTTYPSDYKAGSMDGKGVSSHQSTPVICKSHYGDMGMVRHDAAGEIFPKAELKESPVLQPVWAAGSSFSRGHRVARVPYDLLPMIFDGEEFFMAVRMWTSGYDFYTFRRVLVFHPYARKTRPKTFWENRADMAEKRAAVRRANIMMGIEPSHDYSLAKEVAPGGKYGLGTRRPLATYLKLWGYDLRHHKSRDNCDWAYSQDMHKQLTRFLRDDGKGIDYEQVPVDQIIAKQKFYPVPDQGLHW